MASNKDKFLADNPVLYGKWQTWLDEVNNIRYMPVTNLINRATDCPATWTAVGSLIDVRYYNYINFSVKLTGLTRTKYPCFKLMYKNDQDSTDFYELPAKTITQASMAISGVSNPIVRTTITNTSEGAGVSGQYASNMYKFNSLSATFNTGMDFSISGLGYVQLFTISGTATVGTAGSTPSVLTGVIAKIDYQLLKL